MRLIEVNVLKEWIENWFTKNRFYHPYAKNNNIPITELYDILERLPSAQPEPKKGKWIDYSDDGYVECPFCRSATNCDDNIDELHYCFSCGAKMEV